MSRPDWRQHNLTTCFLLVFYMNVAKQYRRDDIQRNIEKYFANNEVDMNMDVPKKSNEGFTNGSGESKCGCKKSAFADPINMILVIMLVVMAVMYAIQYIQNMQMQSMNEMFRNMMVMKSDQTPIQVTVPAQS